MLGLGVVKISGPYGTGLRVAAYNAASVLLLCLFGALLSQKGDGFDAQAGLLQAISGALFWVLTFPGSLLYYNYTTSSGGGMLDFWFLSPLIWGLAAFGMHKFWLKRRKI
jgi:hypothetical protein